MAASRTRGMTPRSGWTRALSSVRRRMETASARATKREGFGGTPAPPVRMIAPPIGGPSLPPPIPGGGLGGISGRLRIGGGGTPSPPVPAGPISPPPGGPTTPVGGAIAGTVCETLPPVLREACYAAGGWVEGQLVGGAPGGGNGAPPAPSMPSCPSGTVRVGDTCVSPGDVFPGGAPFTSAAGGQAVQGGFGLPALTPVQESRIRRRCPEGFVLGKDNLCYPRQILPRRSKFRKWRPAARPAVTAGDVKAIRRADRARRRLVELTKDAGAHASLTRPRK